jgi:hypothetical protein
MSRPAASVCMGAGAEAAGGRAAWFFFGAGCGSGTPWPAATTGATMRKVPTNAAKRADVIFTSKSLQTESL